MTVELEKPDDNFADNTAPYRPKAESAFRQEPSLRNPFGFL